MAVLSYMLYFEKHDLHLSTFPVGDFSHKIISTEQAKNIIEQAIEDEAFLGIFTHDNANPERADKKFVQCIKALNEHCDIQIPINKFFNEEILEEGETLTFGNPAGLNTLKKGDVLMVVTYCFGFPEKTEKKLAGTVCLICL